jgi:alkylation response protein AidB-like acyl-CoA dehydrogenase
MLSSTSLNLTPEDDAFRLEVRDFLRTSLPSDMRERTARGFHPLREDMQKWQSTLHDRGWAAPHWPKEYGGTGWTPLQRLIFEIECYEHYAPPVSVFGIGLIGPIIFTFGTTEQKQRYLPKILSGEEFWCQGYSEPNSGSDLASLKTSAVREEDVYIVNGHKIWTTEAHYADLIFCLVRTDPAASKVQNGISMLLIDMQLPGVTVKPIITQDMGHSINEVFFENVRVPATCRIGEENSGWTYAKVLLNGERTGSARLPRARQDLRRLKSISDQVQDGGAPLSANPDFAQQIALAEIEISALEAMVYRVLNGSVQQDATAAASMLKVRGSEVGQRLSELWMEALGPHALPLFARDKRANDGYGHRSAPGAAATFLYRRTLTIYGGSNEIQRNIIAKRSFGL